MPLQVSIQSVDAYDNIVFVSGLLIPSGNYPTGGDTVDFTAAVQDPAFTGLQPNIPSSGAPQGFDAWSANGNILFQYAPIQGTTQKNSKVKIGASATFGTELAAGAYPATILADKINFSVQFPKFF